MRRLPLSLLAATSALLLTTGCALSNTATNTTLQATQATGLRGSIHGGQQPIFGSTLVLMQAGSTGYGTGAVSLMNAGASVKSGADGGFNLTGQYTCPTTGSSQVYLLATGGDPTGAANGTINNSAAVMVAALGDCSKLTSSTFISVNEITTAAAAYALGQFFGGFGTASDQIGAPASNQVGLTNAFATAHNLANTTTGAATPTTAASGTNYYLYTNDQNKLNTIANVLAACVNQTSASQSNCQSLFSNVTPTYAPLSNPRVAATQPADVFQAAVYMSLNPTSTNASGSHIADVFNLASSFAVFVPTLSSAPTDWVVGLTYTGTGIAAPMTSAAVDANGDIWFSNQNTTGGVVMLNGGSGVVGGTPGVTGGVIGFYSSGANSSGTTVTANATRQVAIDLNGKAWFGGYNAASDSKYYLFRAVGGSGVDSVYQLTTGNNNPYAIAIDGTNRVFVTTSDTHLDYISATAANTTSPAFDTTHLGGAANGIAVGADDQVYAPRQSNNVTYSFVGNPIGTAVSGTSTGFGSQYGVAVDGSNRAWVVNRSAGGTSTTNLGYFTGSTFTAAPANACLNVPSFPAIDGGGNVWVTNSTANGATTTVCEFDSTGTLISPAAGFGFHNLNTARGVAIDQSGNVWVTNGNVNNFVVQLVGAAAPAVAPLSVAARDNKLGARP